MTGRNHPRRPVPIPVQRAPLGTREIRWPTERLTFLRLECTAARPVGWPSRVGPGPRLFKEERYGRITVGLPGDWR